MTTVPTTVQERFTLPAASGAGAAPSPADIFAMLRRRSVMVVLLLVLFSAATVGGYIAWAKYLPGYRAECLIECISNIPEAGLTLEHERLKQEEHERFVLTQALLLKSPRILEEALKVNAVRDTKWWKSIQARMSKVPNQHLIELTEEVTSAPVRGTNFLRVSMVCKAQEDPAVIVNEVVRQWYDLVRRRATEDFAAEPLETTQAELDEFEGRLEAKRQELRLLAGRLPAGARDNPGNNITAQQVAQYGEQVASLSLELSQLQQYRDMYNDPQGVAVTAEDRAIVEQDPQVSQLSQAVFLLEQQRAADEKMFGPSHAELRRLDAQLDAADEELANLRLEKLSERKEDIREATNTAYLNTQHALLLSQENLARAEAALQDQEQLLFNYTTLEADIQRDEDYKLELVGSIKNLTRMVRRQSAVQINIAQPAIDPLERHSPSILVIPLGLFLALVLSIGLALATEMLDTSVRTSQDLERHLDLAVLGAVPHTDDEEIAIKQVETAVADVPRSMVSEAFRRIVTNLQFSAPAERQRTLLVTSPQPEDGRTSIACNLAIALAQRGKRVLLIDANFRRPGLHKIFDTVKDHGLSNVLVGDDTLAACAARTSVTNLDVLGSGPVPPNPAELLDSEPCRGLLKEAASQYDRVIVDSAPVLLAGDSLALGAAVDGVILVVRAKENSRGVARRARALLAGVGAHMFGAVLNAAQVTRGGYFREQLRTYYDYQVESDAGKA